MTGPEFPPEDALHRMQAICAAIQKEMPAKHRFLVFVLPETWEGQDNSTARAHYAGNIDRPTAIASLKEFMLRNNSDEEWMKHIL
jgi:hypothetical protein